MRTPATIANPGPGCAPGPGPLAVALAAALLLLKPPGAPAHGVEMDSGLGRAAWIRAGYAGGEAMEFAKVRIIDPDGRVYQVGNADAQGRFAWLADREGRWMATAEDGMGHRGEAAVEVGQASPPSRESPAEDLSQTPRLHRAAWGLSVIFWVWGLVFWLRGRRGRRPEASPGA